MPARTATLLLTAALLLCAGGCGRPSQPDEDVVTLSFWHSFVGSSQPALQELIRRFEAEHPRIRIREQYIPTGDALIQKLMAAIQSGTAPDVSWVHADFLGKLVQADAVYPMDRFIDGPDGLTPEALADIHPGLLQSARWRGTLYALPMEGTLLALVYNKDHFREAGLDPERPPRTWEELRATARRLTRDTDGDGKIDRYGFYVPVFPASGPLNIWMVLQWSPYLWQAGGHVVDEGQTRVLYDGEAGVAALELWRELFREMGGRPLSLTHDLSFASGHVAMIMDGPWDLPRFRELTHIDWGVAPLPRGPAKAATYLAGEHLAIFEQSAHPDEAWTFVKWMVRPETQAFFSAASGYLPVTRSTLEMPSYRAHLAQDPGLRAFVEQIPMGQPRRPIDLYQVEVNGHIAEAIERALVGGVDPRRALAAAAARSNALLESPTP